MRPWTRALRAAVVLLAVAPTVVAPAPANGAETRVVDRVVAVVDAEPVLLSELTARAEPLLRQMSLRRPEQRARLYAELLEDTIQRRLLERHALAVSLSVTEPEIDRALAMVAKQNGLSAEALVEQVQKETGMSADAYRGEIRTQILWSKALLRALSDPPTDPAAREAAVEAKRAELLARWRKRHVVSIRVKFR